MKTEKLRGIIIGEQTKGESNKQLIVLAKGVGRVLLSARGAKNARSKLLAATQLFCYADFVVCEGRGFYSVNQAELLKSFYGLRTDIAKLSEAMYLAELTQRTCPAGMVQDEILELLYYAFSVMEKGTLPPKLVSRIFELKLLHLSGVFAPEACAVCEETESPLYFDERLAEFFCQTHARKEHMPLLEAVRRAFAFVLEKEGRAVFGFTLSDEALQQMERILERYMDVHMDLRLKSRGFLT